MTEDDEVGRWLCLQTLSPSGLSAVHIKLVRCVFQSKGYSGLFVLFLFKCAFSSFTVVFYTTLLLHLRSDLLGHHCFSQTWMGRPWEKSVMLFPQVYQKVS